MSSILTNTGAMTALQTLRGINQNLQKTQDMISTGKQVGTAKDNAAVWAISKVMESDVKGFEAISSSLGLGQSTVAVASNAAETVSDLLTEIKGKIVAAQDPNVDRAKIQSDIEQIRDQISSVVGSAQFNGLNLVDNYSTESILGSINRSMNGVTPSDINVTGRDLTTREQVFGNNAARGGQATLSAPSGVAAADATTAGTDITIAGTATADSTASMTFAIGSTNVNVSVLVNTGDTATQVATALEEAIGQNQELASLDVNVSRTGADVEIRLGGESRALGATITGSGAVGGITVPAGPATIAADVGTASVGSGTIEDGDSFRLTIGGEDFEYVANEGSTRSDVLQGLAERINESNTFYARVSSDGQNIEFTQVSTTTAVAAGSATENSGGTAGGGLQDLADLNVSDFSTLFGGANGTTAFNNLTTAEQDEVVQSSLNRSLAEIETMIQYAVDSAASFGSVQGRIETQSNFIASLTDSLKAGIGTLVDANMEEASARLQALQVQQQLGVQSLSIANQAPQTILSLFR